MRFSPVPLFAELKRRHVFSVAAMYAVAGWLVIQIADTVFPHLDFPPWTISFVIVAVLLGFPIALVLAWALEITPAGIKRTVSLLTTDGASPSVATAGSALERAGEEANSEPGTRRIVLPKYPTPLIGRRKELREVSNIVGGSDVRLLTMTGPGGTGKTRLALEAAANLMDVFADGVYLVNLAPITDPLLVPSAIASVLRIKESAGRNLIVTLQEHLREKRVLLLLDNFEQVTDAAETVARLLAAAPGLKLLVTSRIPLHVRGEQEYPVPALSLPDPKHLPSLERLRQYEAVRLFLERAQGVKPNFTLTPENAPAVAEICQRLDGLPLAIELAAARIKTLTPPAMLSRLQSRLKLLTRGARDLPARQQTLRGAIEWSYDLLSEEEKVLFRRLSVFAGGCTLEASEQVGTAVGGPELDVLESLASLVDKSLLKQEEKTEGEPRFIMLETIHEYAREQLEESGEAETVRRRHAEFFLALTEEAEPHVRGGRERALWFSRLEVEHDNLRAALRWALNGGAVGIAARLAWCLTPLWLTHGHLTEGRQWLRGVLSADESLPPAARTRALHGASSLAFRQGDLKAAEQLAQETLLLSRRLGDHRMTAVALNNLSSVAVSYEDHTQAKQLYGESLDLAREMGDKSLIATILNNLGAVAELEGDVTGAKALYEESLSVSREEAEGLGDSVKLRNLGHLMCGRGEHLQAAGLFADALRLALGEGDRYLMTHGLADLALIASTSGEFIRAARLFGAADAEFAAMQAGPQPADGVDYDRGRTAARARLDEAAWAREYEAGASMTLDAAIAYALEEAPVRQRA